MHVQREYSSLKFNEFGKVNHTLRSQYTLKKGLQVFGKAGVEAVTKELQQLHDRNALEPKRLYKLTWEQQVRALAYLMFPKQKRDDSCQG